MNTRSVENSAFEIIAEIFRGVRDWSKSIGGGGGGREQRGGGS